MIQEYATSAVEWVPNSNSPHRFDEMDSHHKKRQQAFLPGRAELYLCCLTEWDLARLLMTRMLTTATAA